MSGQGSAGSRKRKSDQVSVSEHSRHGAHAYQSQGGRTSLQQQQQPPHQSDSASNGGAYFGFHADTNFFVTKHNFVLDQFPVFRNSQTLFFFFEKGDVTGKASHADLKFAHMRKEYRILLKLLLFNAQVFNAHVRLLYLEPTIAEIGERQDLPPSLRCALTSAFCLCVTFPRRPPHLLPSHSDSLSSARLGLDSRGHSRGGGGSYDDDRDDELFGACVSSSQDVFGDVTRRALGLLHDEDANHPHHHDDFDDDDDEEEGGEVFFEHLLFYSKLLACVDLNLISPATCYVVAEDRATAQQVVALYDWKRWKYVPNVLSKRIVGIRFSLDKPFSVGETSITPNALVAAASVYFRRDAAQQPAPAENVAPSSTYPENVLLFVFQRMAVPEYSPVYREYKRRYAGSPALAIIDALCDADARQSFAVDVTDALVFQYSPEHLICKDDLNLFEQAPLFQYPHVSAASGARHLPALVEQLVHSTCNGTDRVLALTGPPALDADGSSAADTLEAKHFDAVWPHLHAYKRALDVVTAGAPLAALRVQYKLFVTVVLKNADKILTQPSNAVFGRAQQLLERRECSPGPFVVNTCKLHYVQDAECRSAVPRLNDWRFFEMTFVHCFALGRACQAYFTLLHLLHSTSPKWKTNKIMLVNHTRGGTGKTHTVQCIQRLFNKIDGVFRSISTMTDAVLKYAEINVAKMIVLDDVGLSRHQQKNSKKEDSMMPAQLKSLLDTGFTVNDATERDAKTRNFKASTKTTVLNAAFVWNTNTTDTFSAALLDRCLVLQSEPLAGALRMRSEHEIAALLRTWRLGERYELMLVRHTVVQTLLFTACARVAAPDKTCDEFVTGLAEGLRRQFPVTKTTNSCLRSGFQLLDMTMAESLRLAVNTVFELWVPPWTVPPRLGADDTLVEYLQKLDAARARALDLVEMHEVLVEVMVQAKLLFPSAATQIVCLHFYRATDNVFQALAALVLAGLRHNARDAVLVLNNVGHAGGGGGAGASSAGGHHGAGDDFVESNRAVVVLNYLNVVCSDVFTLDAIVVKSAMDILFKHPSGVTLRPVEEVGQAHLKMNAFFLVELLKRHWRAETFEATRERLLAVFRAQLEDVLRQREQGATFSKLSLIHYVPADDLEKNFLRLLSAHREQYGELLVKQCHSGDDGGGGLLEFSVSPALWGIADQLAREVPSLDRDVLDQVIPVRFRGREAQADEALRPRMAWFTRDYISEVLLHLFEHAPAVMLPSGNVVGYVPRSARPPAPERLEPFGGVPPRAWEYRQAAEVYRAYECRVDDDLHELQRDCARYLGCVAESESRAERSASLRELLEGLPRTADEAKALLSYRYSKSREEVERLWQAAGGPSSRRASAADTQDSCSEASEAQQQQRCPHLQQRVTRHGLLLWEKLQRQRQHMDA